MGLKPMVKKKSWTNSPPPVCSLHAKHTLPEVNTAFLSLYIDYTLWEQSASDDVILSTVYIFVISTHAVVLFSTLVSVKGIHTHTPPMTENSLEIPAHPSSYLSSIA